MGREVRNRACAGGDRRAGSELPLASERSTSPPCRSSMTLRLGESMNVVL